ncbi:inovirus Gp2 family protein [Xanthomonas prunicola]|uniref:inovirus Gp2 family protein n=1 Tax=Xanthomonas prunicola TaxID=2053930 RepID=UPI0021B3E609|nr:inovirus Gp2 family protein [Xanthomonas prunicola]UXA52312.1 inovirus Gp2 family protein [Xanthomonas prunicola]
MNAVDKSNSYNQVTTFDSDLPKEQMTDSLITLQPKSTEMRPAEQNHHLFVRKTSQRYGYTWVGQEYDFICWLLRAEKLVNAIVQNDDQPIEVAYDRRGQPRHQLTKTGKAFFNVCKGYNQDRAEYYKHHRFNPPLTVILNVVDQWSSELLNHTNRNGDALMSDPRTREIVERAVASIRASCRSQAYKNEVDNYKRNEEKNIASCCDYLAAQFQRRSQLLILRLDLYFRPAFKGWGYTREADGHYARLLRALRENRIAPDVLGYISKREDGIDRGIHFHVLVILDGHKHRDAANLTRMIGEDWVRRCGHGDYKDGVDVGETGKKDKASYFNCYTRLDQYRFNCLGLIHPTDAEKLRGLRLAIEYLCKETTQLKPSPPKSHEGKQDPDIASRKGIRNLRKGIMPKGHSGRGAPRSSGLDTSAVDRELLKK